MSLMLISLIGPPFQVRLVERDELHPIQLVTTSMGE